MHVCAHQEARTFLFLAAATASPGSTAPRKLLALIVPLLSGPLTGQQAQNMDAFRSSP